MIASRLVDWQRRHGRHGLPWQRSRDPYRVWLSEIMLQQTRVTTVLPYYRSFLDRFPDLRSLAAAAVDDVLASWSGLGYYTRARNLHRCAIEVVHSHGGVFPGDPDELAELPGIGRSTAAAIAVFAYGRRAAILDGNVRRVLSRHAGVRGLATQAVVQSELWRIAERELPQRNVETYTQALMDLGATVCSRTRPACHACPLADDCVALREDAVDAIPARRPPREVPQRQCVLLVIRHADRVLLEKRADTGIWGGLWSLPEASCAERVPQGDRAHNGRSFGDEVARRFGLHTIARGELPEIDHAFTHFRLRACPLVLECQGASALSDAVAIRWMPLADAADAALPSPIKALLIRLQRAESGLR